MLRSIRWRLTIWHSLVLLGVVALFGVILFFEARQARFHEIDSELQSAARVLEGALRALPPPELDELFPERAPHRPPRSRPGGDPLAAFDDLKGPPPDERRPKGPTRPEDRKGPEGRKGPPGKGEGKSPQERLEGLFALPRHLTYRYEADRYPYFVIRTDDRVVRSSTSTEVPAWNASDLPTDAEFLARQRGANREVIIRAPHRTTILVGREIQAELDALFGTGVWITLTGISLWGLGLLGGAMLSRGVLRPIERMSAAAHEIAASDFSRRIEPEETVRELDELARVLNNAFDCMQQALAQQVRFSADASHELRTPLAVILSQTEMALSRARSAEEYQETIAACHRAAERMRRLVESLLLLARFDAGEGSLNPRLFDLSEVAGECFEMVVPLAEFRGLTCQSELQPALVTGDRDRLSQVVTNLLANAVNYNRPQGNIVLRVRREGKEAVLSVTDTGVGISAEHLPHLFERFYRVDRSRSRQAGGSGLGLAISQRIVDAHGGKLEAASVLGEGTTFCMRLQLAESAEARREKTELKSEPKSEQASRDTVVGT